MAQGCQYIRMLGQGDWASRMGAVDCPNGYVPSLVCRGRLYQDLRGLVLRQSRFSIRGFAEKTPRADLAGSLTQFPLMRSERFRLLTDITASVVSCCVFRRAIDTDGYCFVETAGRAV